MRVAVCSIFTLSLLALAPAPTVHSAPAAPAAACEGRAATLESSTPGAVLTGTDGPDVIVASAPATIQALGGDDVICAAGGYLDAGAGDDQVYVSDGPEVQEARLGVGHNQYVSDGARTDHLVAASAPVPPSVSDATHLLTQDRVDTGEGPDRVVAGLGVIAGLRAVAGHAGVPSPGSLLVLRGTETNTENYFFSADAVSAIQGTIAAFSGFETTYLDLPKSAGATLFGTRGDDRFYLSAGHISGKLRGGDDVVGVGRAFGAEQTDALDDSAPGAQPRYGRLNFGSGHDDRLYIDSAEPVTLDLLHGRYRGLELTGIDRTSIRAPRVDYRGTTGNDTATVSACRATLRGGPGNDSLGAQEPTAALPALDCDPRLRLYGDGGHDTLTGGPGRDRLIGGRGHDRVNGHGGRDTCQAEVQHNCERIRP